MINELLSRAREGDQEAENRLFQYLFVRFRTIAKRRMGEDGEDLAQEACMTVLEKYKTEEFTKGFEPWAYGVLRMKIGNYIQGPLSKRRREDEMDDRLHGHGPGPEPDPTVKADLLRCLRKILKRNPQYARVLNLSHQGFETGEICEKVQVSANNMYVMLNRGRRMLKHCLRTGQV